MRHTPNLIWQLERAIITANVDEQWWVAHTTIELMATKGKWHRHDEPEVTMNIENISHDFYTHARILPHESENTTLFHRLNGPYNISTYNNSSHICHFV